MFNKERIIFFLAVTMLFCPVGIAYALNPETPDHLVAATIVDADWVKSKIGKIKIFDVRKKAEYIEGHLPGAVSAAYKEKSLKNPFFDMTKDSLNLKIFPENKNEPIIVYCNGSRCWKSFKASVTLIKEGYKNVNWFRGGFPEWQEKGFSIE